jgi:FtsH Extracellular
MSVSVSPGDTDRVSGRMLRTLVLWALIVVGAVSLIQYASSPREDAPEISLSQFHHELDQRNVATVVVNGTHVRGVFRRPVVVRRDVVTQFSLRLRGEPADTFTAFVARYGAVVVHDDDPRD